MLSIGKFLAKNQIIQCIIFAPLFMSKTNGFRGTLEASISEGFIFISFIEFFHSFSQTLQPITKRRKILNILRGCILMALCGYESYTFIMRSNKHCEKYILAILPNESHPVTCVAQSIGAVLAMCTIINFFLIKTRI